MSDRLMYVKMIKSSRKTQLDLLKTIGEKYNLRPYFYKYGYCEKTEFKWFVPWIKDKPNDVRILDCCCGIGLLAACLDKHGYTEYYGSDINPEYVRVGTELFEELGLRGKITEGNVHELATHYNGLFDIVTMFDVSFFPGIDLIRVADQVLQALKPGGWFIFDFAEFKRIKSEINLYSRVEIRAILAEFSKLSFSRMKGNKTRWMVVAKK